MTDATNNGWPDEAREVVARALCMCDGERFETRHGMMNGPCEQPHNQAAFVLAALAPFVAAREAAAAQAMRDACAAIVDAHAAAAKRCSEEGDVIYRIRAEFLANSYAITQAADDVRVTPLPDKSALDAMLAEARREGMREAAGLGGVHAAAYRETMRDEKSNASQRGMAERMAAACDDLAAAILAAIEKEPTT
jgi:hydroxylamine reductase (hybrid-cluster protein)